MYGEVLNVEQGPLAYMDAGGCSVGFMRYFPFDNYQSQPVTPDAFAQAEKQGGTYSGLDYRKAWLATIKVPSQSRMRDALGAAGYVLMATSPCAHTSEEHMELWGKGFTISKPVEGPARKLRERAIRKPRVARIPHRRAAKAALNS
jgi:hypothetical protein